MSSLYKCLRHVFVYMIFYKSESIALIKSTMILQPSAHSVDTFKLICKVTQILPTTLLFILLPKDYTCNLYVLSKVIQVETVYLKSVC